MWKFQLLENLARFIINNWSSGFGKLSVYQNPSTPRVTPLRNQQFDLKRIIVFAFGLAGRNDIQSVPGEPQRLNSKYVRFNLSSFQKSPQQTDFREAICTVRCVERERELLNYQNKQKSD